MSVTNGTDSAATGDVLGGRPALRPPHSEFREIVDSATTTVSLVRRAMKNLIQNMLVIGVLRFDDGERQGRDPDTGAPYSYKTISLDLQHAEVRKALHLG